MNIPHNGLHNSLDGDAAKIRRKSIKQKILDIFLLGFKKTAKELNELTNGNDARKCISKLRSEGYNIIDSRIGRQAKYYWINRKGANHAD